MRESDASAGGDRWRAGGLGPLPTISPEGYRRITFLVLAGVCFIIVTGASVRLTGSGLGCTAWPNCEDGSLVAELETHAIIEFGNRLVTGLIAFPILAALIGSRLRDPRRNDLTWWSLGLVAGVAAQAIVGKVSVEMELAPPFISIHFLLSIVLVWNAVVLHHRAGTPEGAPVAVVAPLTVRLSRLMLVAAAIVLATGTFVTGTGPHAGDERAQRYTFAEITDVARVHSLVAWAFLALTLVVVWRLARTGAPADVDARARRLVAAILFQGALGYAQYAAGVPPYLVIVHIAGSVVVFILALSLHLSLFARPTERPAAAPAGDPVGDPGGATRGHPVGPPVPPVAPA